MRIISRSTPIAYADPGPDTPDTLSGAKPPSPAKDTGAVPVA